MPGLEGAPVPQPPQAPRTDEELRQGFDLGPDESVSFPIEPDPTKVSRAWDVGNGIRVTGQPVAEFVVGGDTTSARGLIINTFDAPGRRDYIVVLEPPDPNETRKFSAKLEPGQMWDIGRRVPGQDMLPDTVSGDHCAVGLDEEGKLVIENHKPTNMTHVRKI